VACFPVGLRAGAQYPVPQGSRLKAQTHRQGDETGRHTCRLWARRAVQHAKRAWWHCSRRVVRWMCLLNLCALEREALSRRPGASAQNPKMLPKKWYQKVSM
jgi:hypothetical protein